MTLRAHFVTDRRRFAISTSELVRRAARAAARGADVIQIRERDLDGGALAALVREVIVAVAATPARVLVNDRADVAIAAGAHGVHLRGDSPPAPRLRAIVPHGFVIGRSVHSDADIDAAVHAGGCDYLLFGTVFPSEGKPPDHRVAGLEGLARAVARSPVPIVAIGGMDAARAAAAAEVGAAGFAAVGLFMYSDDSHG